MKLTAIGKHMTWGIAVALLSLEAACCRIPSATYRFVLPTDGIDPGQSVVVSVRDWSAHRYWKWTHEYCIWTNSGPCITELTFPSDSIAVTAIRSDGRMGFYTSHEAKYGTTIQMKLKPNVNHLEELQSILPQQGPRIFPEMTTMPLGVQSTNTDDP